MRKHVAARLFENRYISAIHSQTDQVSEEFAAYIDEMYPVRLCLHILPDASVACMQKVLGRTCE